MTTPHSAVTYCPKVEIYEMLVIPLIVLSNITWAISRGQYHVGTITWAISRGHYHVGTITTTNMETTVRADISSWSLYFNSDQMLILNSCYSSQQ